MIQILKSDAERSIVKAEISSEFNINDYVTPNQKAQELRTKYNNNPLYDVREDGSVWQYELMDLLPRIIRLEKELGI